jgi:hypothetical protein
MAGLVPAIARLDSHVKIRAGLSVKKARHYCRTFS